MNLKNKALPPGSERMVIVYVSAGLVCVSWAGFFSSLFFQQFNCSDYPRSQQYLWNLVTTEES